MALYLGTTLIASTAPRREVQWAGAVFRLLGMMNANVVHLAGLADVGTTVTVVSALPGGADHEPGSAEVVSPHSFTRLRALTRHLLALLACF
jgi:hypothetical protein